MRGGEEWMGLCRMYQEAQKEVAAAERAVAISQNSHRKQASPAWEAQIQVERGVEL